MLKLLLASIFFLLAGFTPSLACTCINSKGLTTAQHNKYLKGIKAIFEGEVVSLGEKRTFLTRYSEKFSDENTVQAVRFKVFRVWKGPEQPEVTVETDVVSSCRFVPTVGSKFTVYAGQARDGKGGLAVNLCSVGTFDDEKMKVEYGEGRVIKHPEPVSAVEVPTGNPYPGIWQAIVSFFS